MTARSHGPGHQLVWSLMVGFFVVVTLESAHAGPSQCSALGLPSGTIVSVSNETELQTAIRGLSSNTTVLIQDGVYNLTNTLVVGGVNNVEIRGASGDRDAVQLVGRGMSNPDYRTVPHGFLVQDVDNLLIADMTIRDAYYHNIQIAGEHGPTRVRMYNLHLIDAGEQQIKGSSAGPPGPYADDCSVECSLIEYTDRARSWYTNGVDVLAGANWVIRDNVFERIRAPIGELAGPAVLMWRNCLDTIVERNVFFECDRGPALGLSSPDPTNARDGETVYDHQGGVIRNNFFYRSAGSPTGDVGIGVNYARDYKIHHNTVILNGSFPWTIEYRFDVSDGELAYNLTDGNIMARTGALGTLTGNVTSATPAWFVDAASGDLHLLPTATGAIDMGAPHADVSDDLDNELRDSTPDIGADELVSCVLPVAPVVRLIGTKLGTDAVFSWDPDTGISAYNLWHVDDKLNIDSARVTSSPPAVAVAGCAEPSPASAAGCTDSGALARSGSLYYQVRASCGGLAEGP